MRTQASDFFVLTVSESAVRPGSRAAVAPINVAFAAAPTAREAYARVMRDPHGYVLSSRWHGRLAYLEDPVVASPPAKRRAAGAPPVSRSPRGGGGGGSPRGRIFECTAMSDALCSVPVVRKRQRCTAGGGAPLAHDAAFGVPRSAASIGSVASDFARSVGLDAAAAAGDGGAQRAGGSGGADGRKKRLAAVPDSPHSNTFRNKRMRPAAMPAGASSGSEGERVAEQKMGGEWRPW